MISFLFILSFILPISADELVSGTRYLRNVSIDLIGRSPTLEEYAQMGDDGSLPEALLDEWLSSEEFAEQVAFNHQRFFWNNVGGRRLSSYSNWLHSNGDLIYARGRTNSYRYSGQSCGDWEEPFDEDGFPESQDCEDNDSNTFPGAAEKESTTLCMSDADGDGYGASTTNNPNVTAGTDCNDADANIHPEANETPGDQVDSNCNGNDDD